MKKPLIGIVMGSDSDLSIMQEAADILQQFGVEFELKVISAHRAPELTADYAKSASERGLQVIIGGAGGAAHLPGVIAALTTLPVIGVPIRSSNSIAGMDSLLSIAQMPPGVPVATVGVNAAKNAGVLAVQMLALHNQDLSGKLSEYKQKLVAGVQSANDRLNR